MEKLAKLDVSWKTLYDMYVCSLDTKGYPYRVGLSFSVRVNSSGF
jgi:hypothetical protein